MRKSNSNKMNMFEAVIRTCLKYQSVWANDAVFTEVFTRFNVLVNEAKALETAYVDLGDGVAAEKLEIREDIADELVALNARLKAFAKRSGNRELFKSASVSKSTLLIIKEVDFIAEVASKISLFQNHLAELGGYNITPQHIDSLQVLLDTFETKRSEARELDSEKKAILAQQNVKIKGAVSVLKDELNGIMTTYHVQAPHFFKVYTNSRAIIDLKGAGKTKPGGTINPIPPEGPERSDDSIV